MSMRAAMLLPLLVSGALWLIGARLGRWLPPATAVRLLSLAAVVTALSTGFILAIAAFLVLARAPAIATLGHWSTATVSLDDPIPTSAGLLAGATVLVLLFAALRRFALAGRDLATAATACRQLGPGTNGLVIVDDEEPDAYALPGLTGRVVVSTAMLRALPADERRVLLAHEAAHLRHHHHLYVQLAELGAAANPLLRRLALAVRDGAERWADEDAAAEVGDRALAARALARAGLARALASPGRRLAPLATLPAVDSGVAHRALALLAPRPRRRRWLAVAVATLVLIPLAAAAITAHDTEHRFELAQAAYSGPR
jgi:Zn-dependent protease with chaperone function